jgi:hypothetical protein
MKKLLATLSAIVLSGAIAFGANLPLITGPTPAADLQFFLNQLIQSINNGVGGLINAQTAAVATAATTVEQTLQTYSLPASTLSTAGQSVRATCWGTSGAGASNARSVKLYFGSTAVTTPVLASTGWSVSYIAMRRTATTQGFDGTAFYGDNKTISPTVADGAETLTAAVVIKCTGTDNVASASGITANGMIVELVK